MNLGPPKPLTPEQIAAFKRRWDDFLTRPMVALPRPPRAGLALSVVGNLNRVKHRVRRMLQRGTIAELLLGAALVAAFGALIAKVMP